MHPLAQPEEQRPEPALAAPMRVLILGRDRQFKRMARLLFERRGSTVRTGADPSDAVELAGRHRAEVVVLDASEAFTATVQAAAALTSLPLPVGIVLVSAEPAGVGMSVLEKWGPFEDLFAEAARVHRSSGAIDWSADVAL